MRSTFVTVTPFEQLTSRPVAMRPSDRRGPAGDGARDIEDVMRVTKAVSRNDAPVDMFSERGLLRAAARVAARLS